MESLDTLEVRLARWGQDRAAIRALRHAVFSVEQGISETLGFDGRDHECVQALARLGDTFMEAGIEHVLMVRTL